MCIAKSNAKFRADALASVKGKVFTAATGEACPACGVVYSSCPEPDIPGTCYGCGTPRK